MCGLPFKRRCGPKASDACRSSGGAGTAGDQAPSCAASGSSASGLQAMQLDVETLAEAEHTAGSFGVAVRAAAPPNAVQQRNCDTGANFMYPFFSLELVHECSARQHSRRPLPPGHHVMLQAEDQRVASLGQDEDMRSPLPDALLTSAVILERGPAPVAAARIAPRGIPLRTQQSGCSF
jgi:hypothetical protein